MWRPWVCFIDLRSIPPLSALVTDRLICWGVGVGVQWAAVDHCSCQRPESIRGRWRRLVKQMFISDCLCGSLSRILDDKRQMRLRNAAHPCNGVLRCSLTSTAIKNIFIGGWGKTLILSWDYSNCRGHKYHGKHAVSWWPKQWRMKLDSDRYRHIVFWLLQTYRLYVSARINLTVEQREVKAAVLHLCSVSFGSTLPISEMTPSHLLRS